MREEAVTFGAKARLIGVLTLPEAAAPDRSPSTLVHPEGAPALILLNAGLLHRVGPHRLYVRLAREAAEAGLPALRFDFSGVGDSGPRMDGVPKRDALLAEVREAMDWLSREYGVERFVLGGLCSGADNAYRAALEDDRVVGAVLIDWFPYRTLGYYLRHYRRRILRGRSWTNLLTGRHPVWRGWGRSGPETEWQAAIESESEAAFESASEAAPEGLADRDVPPRAEAEAGLRRLAEAGVDLLMVYSAGLPAYHNGPRQFAEAFPDVVRSGRFTEVYFPAADHTFTLPSERDRLVARVGAWLGKRWADRPVDGALQG